MSHNLAEIITVAIVFGAVVSIVKTSLRYAERLMRIKYGYPIDGETPRKAEYIDYTDGERRQ